MASCGQCDSGGHTPVADDGGTPDQQTADATPRDGVGDSATAGDGADASGPKEPLYHRREPADCPRDRPTDGPEWSFGECDQRFPSEEGCLSDDECTEGTNARCIPWQLSGCLCTYDECFTDEDCETDEVCECGDRSRLLGHTCVPANCRTDADCGLGSWCAASYPCLQVFHQQMLGYFCTTPLDMCTANEPCSGDCTARCNSVAGKRWTCDCLCGGGS